MTAHINLSQAGVLAKSLAASVTLLEPVARFSLRTGAAGQAKLSAALGLTLPTKVGQRTQAGQTEVLCLGPDEWMLHTSESLAGTILQACESVYADAPHSLTEISDREVTVRIEGPKASELLTLGCPRDLDKLPVGEARRTVFDGATIILWRDAAETYRIDVWRSFAPHLISLLQTGCGELAAE
ncbi:sarcosine oxidase subunit gamma [Roseibium suaedae]|uniref:Sarcosine oxidase subunit gamma n=1 Tax=Roseibium suaedae TaxID=735517 RepID=A0A1M7NNY9_9HYPH|nr:sarcosine oxidase subunit gamma [Roseibium suaedae]SHN05619.1 sarcosine oxidase subunit gamma [Roseibium suaedae]